MLFFFSDEQFAARLVAVESRGPPWSPSQSQSLAPRLSRGSVDSSLRLSKVEREIIDQGSEGASSPSFPSVPDTLTFTACSAAPAPAASPVAKGKEKNKRLQRTWHTTRLRHTMPKHHQYLDAARLRRCSAATVAHVCGLALPPTTSRHRRVTTGKDFRSTNLGWGSRAWTMAT
ncbi:hypothetical protein SCLCIDRAFT_991822 [Scleroderma citrinum Foug A]|uniref:Uncharacterized protein n=1 Tax=Scleroderma citrinum Foug A TaxID=1036808 RepID=A0A0C3DUR1_9AGAM|nr:hypothetical protein SCLCIDRAFT_991822 [Scleroderma citrinum Foug A]